MNESAASVKQSGCPPLAPSPCSAPDAWERLEQYDKLAKPIESEFRKKWKDGKLTREDRRELMLLLAAGLRATREALSTLLPSGGGQTPESGLARTGSAGTTPQPHIVG